MTAQGIFSALKEPFNKNIIIKKCPCDFIGIVFYVLNQFWSKIYDLYFDSRGRKNQDGDNCHFWRPNAKNFADLIGQRSISKEHTFHNDGANYWPVDLMTLRLLLLNATQRPKGMAIGGRVLNPVLWSPDHQNTKSPDHQNTTGPRVQPKYLKLSHQASHLFTDFPLWRKL